MRTVSHGIVAILIVASLAAIDALAEVHPVPITPTTDCTACHQDKANGKVVHPAVEMGCTTCHAVVTRDKITYVEIRRGGPPTLCFECHADKQPAAHHAAHPISFEITAKAGETTIACTACHDPHTSRYDHLLKKPESGNKGQNLCLDCHTIGLNVPKGGSRHPALDLGCNSCHVLHKQGRPDRQEFIFQLTKPAPALCAECHETGSAELQSAHHGFPVASANCTNCHDPHSSARPALAQRTVHPPYAAGKCNSCHSGASGNTLTFVKGGGSALCFNCHRKTEQKIDNAVVQHPALAEQGSCTDCHNPHASRYNALITPDPVRACTNCHQDLKQVQMTAQVLHAPVFDRHKGCTVCHAPHGADEPNLLRQPVQQTCAMCHAELTSKRRSPRYKAVPGTKIVISQKYLANIEKISMHQVHTEGLPDPRNPKQTISCVTCHVPHGGGKGLLVTGGTSSTKLCLECHTIKDL